MTDSPAAPNEQSTGLKKHRGVFDANSVRATGVLNARTEAGIELAYIQSSKNGLVQSYDRDANQYTDLNLTGRNIVLATAGGKVTLPAGSAQALVGQYRAIPSFSIPAINAWYETPVQANVTATGALHRIECCGTVTHTNTAATLYLGFMLDGSPLIDSLQAMSVALANQQLGYSIVAYSAPAAGPHRWSLMMYSNGLGAALWAGAYQNLWVTEQRA